MHRVSTAATPEELETPPRPTVFPSNEDARRSRNSGKNHRPHAATRQDKLARVMAY